MDFPAGGSGSNAPGRRSNGNASEKREKENQMNPKNPIVSVKQLFTASAERVFDAWLDSDRISKWMFGPALREEEILRIQLDPRVGGTFSFLVRRQGEEIDHIGEYFEIDRPRRLVFSWGIAPDAPESRVIVKIIPVETGCELTLTHEMHPKWAEYVSRTTEGWTKMLRVLESQLNS
jgi:uncharacterized protein YndB with AHSA1/START domain